jgi:hypothetical protein
MKNSFYHVPLELTDPIHHYISSVGVHAITGYGLHAHPCKPTYYLVVIGRNKLINPIETAPLAQSLAAA